MVVRVYATPLSRIEPCLSYVFLNRVTGVSERVNSKAKPGEGTIRETATEADLADRIVKTREKKDELLLVLSHPEIPLHNNDSELGARQRVRKRDVSFGPRTSIGALAWDTMQSLVGTAKKLGVNIYEYFADRVTGKGAVPRLAEVIEAKATELNLGGSW